MSPEEIIAKFTAYIDQHEQGKRGSHQQDPYKSDFFTLFSEAYNRKYMEFSHTPRLTADGLRDSLPAHIALESPLLQDVLNFWEEWT